MRYEYEIDDLKFSLKTRRKIKEQERRDRADFWFLLVWIAIVLIILAFYVSVLLWKLSK
jgi:hypothetical protein